MSADLLNQHAVISDLQQTEEILVDQHKAMNEFLQQFLPESQKLHHTTNYVEYDQDSKWSIAGSFTYPIRSMMCFIYFPIFEQLS